MTFDALKASAAYAAAARIGAETPVRPADRPDFSGLVSQALSATGERLAAGETAAVKVAAGEASVVDVVTAVAAAEAALETAIAVRNRVIEAYQEVLRMPI